MHFSPNTTRNFYCFDIIAKIKLIQNESLQENLGMASQRVTSNKRLIT
jgi:hypothetical protein